MAIKKVTKKVDIQVGIQMSLSEFVIKSLEDDALYVDDYDITESDTLSITYGGKKLDPNKLTVKFIESEGE